MAFAIGCVVEGKAEVESVPFLVRRIIQDLDPSLPVCVPRPVRMTKSKLLKAGELERAVKLAALNIQHRGAILVLLDSDDDCPARLGPELLARVRAARPDLPSGVVLAKHEFESWLIAAAESLRGRRGLPNDLQSTERPEEIQGAKEWLSRHVTTGAYSATVDQTSLMVALDLALARRAPSFDKCCREVERLVRTLAGIA